MEFKDSKTMANLMTTFAGESQARTRYDFYASVAKKEGYEQIAGIFSETAMNEKEHAERAYRFMSRLGGTQENLLAAADGEHFEWSELYKGFAQQAQAEGYGEIERFFTEVAKVEEEHETRYRKLWENLTGGQVFRRDDPQTQWHCRNCGYVHIGANAPEVCPSCQHRQAYFEILATNY